MDSKDVLINPLLFNDGDEIELEILLPGKFDKVKFGNTRIAGLKRIIELNPDEINSRLEAKSTKKIGDLTVWLIGSIFSLLIFFETIDILLSKISVSYFIIISILISSLFMLITFTILTTFEFRRKLRKLYSRRIV